MFFQGGLERFEENPKHQSLIYYQKVLFLFRQHFFFFMVFNQSVKSFWKGFTLSISFSSSFLLLFLDSKSTRNGSTKIFYRSYRRSGHKNKVALFLRKFIKELWPRAWKKRKKKRRERENLSTALIPWTSFLFFRHLLTIDFLNLFGIPSLFFVYSILNSFRRVFQ